MKVGELQNLKNSTVEPPYSGHLGTHGNSTVYNQTSL